MNFVLSFTDRIGGNSSSMSEEVAKKLNSQYASFGRYIRKEIVVRGLPHTRAAEQELGKLLIAQGWEQFCGDVLREANWRPGLPVVIDGIRHVKALRTIERITAAPIVKVYVEADEASRKARLIGHEVENDAEFERAEADSTEEEVRSVLPEIADLVVDSNESPEQVISEIMKLVELYVKKLQAQENEFDRVGWLKQAEILAPARQRGEVKRQQLLVSEGGTVNVDEAAALLNVTPDIVDARRQQGHLIGLEIENIGYVYPRWQFLQGEPLPGLDNVLDELRNYDPWTKLAFMLNPNIRLEGEIPLNALRQGYVLEVQRAARSYGVQGGA